MAAERRERNVTKAGELEERLRRSQDLERLGRLVGGLAHEIRNPLNAIQGLAEALALDIGDNPELAPYFDAMRRETTRLGGLARDLLEPAGHLSHSLRPP